MCPLLTSSGQITQEESLFTYPGGMGVDDFSDPLHIPPFMDDLVVDQAIVDMCGGDIECMFDATVTGIAELGMATLMVDVNNTEDLITSGLWAHLVYAVYVTVSREGCISC